MSLPATRGEARATGSPKYDTNQPCLRGHLSPRNTIGAKCCKCERERQQRNYHDNNGKAAQQATRRLKSYGLVPAEFDAMLVEQSNACAVCAFPFIRGWDAHSAPRVDHDHSTGKVRGLLCRVCNVALGLFKDRPDFLRTAATYLEKHRDT